MALPNPFSLAGKTAVVAGASRGIGLAIARGIAAAGAHTILAARTAASLDKAAAELCAAGLSAEARALDVASPESIENFVAALPPVDILLNVAGINVRRRAESYTPEEYDRIMNTNMRGIFHLTQRIGAAMIERGRGGKIVFIGSLTSTHGLPYVSIYAMTKAGLAGLTRALAAEWGRYNIQVNCIAPGFIITDLNREMWQPPHMQEWLRSVQPMPRAGTPEEMAPVAVFLSSPGADFVTGQILSADGGVSAGLVWPFTPAS